MQTNVSHPAAPPHRVQQTLIAERETMISRGDLFSACLDPVVGSEQGGVRPGRVIQNDVGNRFSTTTIVLPITTDRRTKKPMPTHVYIGLTEQWEKARKPLKILGKTGVMR